MMKSDEAGVSRESTPQSNGHNHKKSGKLLGKTHIKKFFFWSDH